MLQLASVNNVTFARIVVRRLSFLIGDVVQEPRLCIADVAGVRGASEHVVSPFSGVPSCPVLHPSLRHYRCQQEGEGGVRADYSSLAVVRGLVEPCCRSPSPVLFYQRVLIRPLKMAADAFRDFALASDTLQTCRRYDGLRLVAPS